MGSVKKVGNEYYIEFFARGLKYQQKAGHDRAQAQKLLEKVEGEIAGGELKTIVRDVDIAIFLKDFLEYAASEHPPRSVYRYKTLIQNFSKFLKTDYPHLEKLSGLTPRVFEVYKDKISKQSKGKATTLESVNFALVLLKDILEYARKLGYLNDNPILHIKFAPIKNKSTLATISEEELNVLCRQADEQFAQILKFIYLTGVTLPELVDLKWRGVDWDNGCFSVSMLKQKRRSIPMTAAVLEILRKQGEGGRKQEERIFVDSKGKAYTMKYLRESLSGLAKGATFLTLRHSFARNLIQRNFSLIGLCKILGFSDVAQGMIYFPFLVDKKDDTLTPSVHSIG